MGIQLQTPEQWPLQVEGDVMSLFVYCTFCTQRFDFNFAILFIVAGTVDGTGIPKTSNNRIRKHRHMQLAKVA